MSDGCARGTWIRPVAKLPVLTGHSVIELYGTKDMRENVYPRLVR